MAAQPDTSIKLPIYTRFNGEEIELGEIEIPIHFVATPNGG